ncbi:hypothetical protein D1AOALGA4SA_1129 [Olavius algarvensis Delta 1 endosymbiont]|nr:hypothetical protein D1AOALGA4SA_1129 [Olavius algarvensis Delta 1 endosymbiont]
MIFLVDRMHYSMLHVQCSMSISYCFDLTGHFCRRWSDA